MPDYRFYEGLYEAHLKVPAVEIDRFRYGIYGIYDIEILV